MGGWLVGAEWRCGARAGQSARSRQRATATARPRYRPFATQCTRCLAADSLRGPPRFHAPIHSITLRYMTTNFNIPIFNWIEQFSWCFRDVNDLIKWLVLKLNNFSSATNVKLIFLSVLEINCDRNFKVCLRFYLMEVILIAFNRDNLS